MTFVRNILIALALLITHGAHAQNYPDRPIRMIVGFTPGSATDITGRMFAQKLSEALGVPVTVENIPGAGGSAGGERAARATPDGYTLYWGANGAMTINPTLLPNPAFDPARDLVPIARLLVSPTILAVNNDVPAKSVTELVALIKSQPGKLSYASPGPGTPQHIAGELFKAQLGLDLVHVPYRGANFTDVIGGRIAMTFQNAGAVLATVRDGKLRALAMTARQRSPNMPEIPTMIEAGVPDFEVTSWFGLLAPAGTSAQVIAKLHNEAIRIAAMPELVANFGKIGLDVVSDAPDAFGAIIRNDTQKWAKVIKDAGIKAGD